MNTTIHFRMLLAIAVGGMLTATLCLAADPAGKPAAKAGQSWALLIGIEKYHRVPHLRYTMNDVHVLAKTLRQRGGFTEILEMYDDAKQPKHQPLKASIEAELADWLKQPRPEDTVVVFFSGHGFRDADSKMYLAPIDCNPTNLAKTGIAVEWVRQQIAGCKAKFKLLILDACHAGSEKGEGDQNAVTANDLGDQFRELEGVVTLASSTAKEQSQIWEEKQQSLFSYWLNQGLRGHADADGDGLVDIDELYKYLHRNVTHTAKTRMPLKQTPVRIVRSGTPDVPAVLRLSAMTLRQVLDDMAEQLADAVVDRKLPKVGVLEFTNDTKLGELLGANFGLLGRYCAEELERQLAVYGEGKFNVVDRRRLQTALQGQGFKLSDLGSPEALQRLSKATGGLPTIALGTLRNRAGQVVHVQCKLVFVENDELAGSAGGAAVLNESEWAMLGRSVTVKPEYRMPELPPPGQTARPIVQQVVQKLDIGAEGPHPLSDPRFQFPVKIIVGGKPRPGVMKGNDYYVPLRKGEIYQIHIENRTADPVVMRLLVDGLNTLPEQETTKGVKTYIVGKRVSLDGARPWEMDPRKAYQVPGFVTETGAKGQYRDFVVVDANVSLAARQKFTDQIGIITAAFYAPVSGARTVGTDLGEAHNVAIEEGVGYPVGPLLAVVHIRYVEPEALNAVPARR